MGDLWLWLCPSFYNCVVWATHVKFGMISSGEIKFWCLFHLQVNINWTRKSAFLHGEVFEQRIIGPPSKLQEDCVREDMEKPRLFPYIVEALLLLLCEHSLSANTLLVCYGMTGGTPSSDLPLSTQFGLSFISRSAADDRSLHLQMQTLLFFLQLPIMAKTSLGFWKWFSHNCLFLPWFPLCQFFVLVQLDINCL